MQKRNLKREAVYLNESLNDANNSLYTPFYLNFEIIDSKTLKPLPPAKKKTFLQNLFYNNFIEEISLSCIFNDPLVKATLPNRCSI